MKRSVFRMDIIRTSIPISARKQLFDRTVTLRIHSLRIAMQPDCSSSRTRRITGFNSSSSGEISYFRSLGKDPIEWTS